MGNLIGGLSQVAQGFAEIGNAFEYRDKLDQKKKELELQQKELDLNNQKVSIANREVGLQKLGALTNEYQRLYSENPQSASDYLKLQETQDTINDISPKIGVSPDRAVMTMKNNAEFFRVRKDTTGQMLNAYANHINSDAPEIAASLRTLTGNIAKANTPEQLESITKDGREILNSAFQFSRLNKEQPNAIRLDEYYKNYREPVPGEPGSISVPIKGAAPKQGIPLGPKESNISPSESESLKKNIAQQVFGIMDKVLPTLDPSDKEGDGKYLPYINDFTSQAEQKVKQGTTPQQAVKETLSEQTKQADDFLTPLLQDKATADALKKKLGTTDLRSVPLKQKLDVVQQLKGAQ